MLAIPILLCVVLLTIAGQSIEEQVSRANDITMRHMRESVDSRMNEMKTILLDVAWDKEVTAFLSAQEPFTTADTIQEVEIINYLKQQLNLAGFASSLYIYYGQSDRFLTSTGAYPPENMYELNLSLPAASYQSWHSSLRQKGKDCELLSYRLGGQTVWEGLTLHMYLPFGSRGAAAVDGRISIAANAEKLRAILQEMGGEGSQSFLIGSDGRTLVSSSGSTLPSQLENLEFPGETGTVFAELAGKPCAVAYIRSEVNGWLYVSVTPKEIFFRHVSGLQLATQAGVLLCVLLGLLNAYLLSRRSYRRVRALTDRIHGEAGDEGDEFERLGHYIELSQRYKREISQRLQAHRSFLRQQCVHDLLFGVAQENGSLSDALAGCGVSFLSPFFAVAVIDGEGAADAHGRQLLGPLFEQLGGGDLAVWSCRVGGAPVLLLNPAGQHSEGRLRVLLEHGCAAAFSQFSLTVFAAVSAVHETVRGVSSAYNEAREALSYRIVRNDAVLLYREASGEGGAFCSVFPPRLQQKLANCVRAMDVKQSRAIMEEITASLGVSFSPSLARCVMFSVINTVLNALGGMKQIPGGREPMQRLLACRTMEEMSAVLSDTLDAVEAQAGQLQQQEGVEEEVKAFVAAHYTDYSLNIAAISEALQRNPAYLSRCFREKSGVPLLDYLNLYRLDRAEELLHRRQLSLQDIAAQVGYNNSNALIRAYKKYRGVTPGKYRELLAKEEKENRYC